jgi:hypothetical protein
MAHLYEFAAKLYGYENWSTFSALLERNDESREKYFAELGESSEEGDENDI